MKNLQGNVCLVIVFILAAAYICLFASVLIMKYDTFNPSYTVDGMSVRIIKHFAATGVLQPYYETTKGVGHCLLFYPLGILSIPLFLLFPYPQWVMIVHTTFIAAAVFPLYYLCRRILRSSLLSLAVISAYLLHPHVNIFTLQGFRVPAIAIPLLFSLFYFMYKKNKQKTLIFLILSNLVIINVVWMTAILAMAFYIVRKCPLDKLVFKISAVWCIVILAVVSVLFILNKDSFPAGYVHLDGYGNNLREVIKTAIAHPDLVAENIFREAGFFAQLFILPPGVISLFAWPFLLPATLETAFTLFAGNKISTVALIFPFLFLSAVIGMAVIRKTLNRLLLCLPLQNPPCSPLLQRGDFQTKMLNIILAVFIFTAAAVAHYYYPLPQMEEAPFSRRFDFNKYKMSRHAYVGHYVLGLLPKDEACLVTPAFVNHLYDCKRFGRFPYDLEKYNWDYVLIDTRDGRDKIRLIGQKTGSEEESLYGNALKKLLAGDSGYGIYLFIDEYLMLKKGHFQQNHKKVIDSIIKRLDS